MYQCRPTLKWITNKVSLLNLSTIGLDPRMTNEEEEEEEDPRMQTGIDTK